MNAFYAEPAPCISFSGARRALFLGVGGGGDVVSAAVLARCFERCGGTAFIGSLLWERFVYDPEPGPIPFERLVNSIPIATSLALVTPTTYAVRRFGIVRPQASRVSQAVSRPVIGLDITKRVDEASRELEELCRYLSIDVVVAVDVGGDALASEPRDDLWSPLADAVGLAIVSRLGLPTALAIVSPGADGELGRDDVMRAVESLASVGALLGGYVVGRLDAEVYESVLSIARSEASSIPARAARGFRGEISIRGGTRRVLVDIASCCIYILSARAVASRSLARVVEGCDDVYSARRKLNSMGVYTELDLEEDLLDAFLEGRPITPSLVEEIRRRGMERVRRVRGGS